MMKMLVPLLIVDNLPPNVGCSQMVPLLPLGANFGAWTGVDGVDTAAVTPRLLAVKMWTVANQKGCQFVATELCCYRIEASTTGSKY